MATLEATRYTIPLDPKGIKEELRTKYRTLTSWRETTAQSLTKRRSCREEGGRTSRESKYSKTSRLADEKPRNPPKEDLAALDLSSLRSSVKRSSLQQSILEDGPEVKLKRRDRLKHSRSPLEIVRHYVRYETFEPTTEELKLVETFMRKHPVMLMHLKNDELEQCLSVAYELLNMAVDFNAMRFLCLLLDFIGKICLYMGDFGKSAFFFEQLRIACTYNKNNQLKVDALIGLAKNATHMKMYRESHIILKKALQYSWAVGNEDKELLIYDLMGINYYYLGQLKKAAYFHNRFMLGRLELPESATKRISFEILNDYQQLVHIVESENLTSLFLEFMTLPIYNVSRIPNCSKKVYENYSSDGSSPRKVKDIEHFNQVDFDAEKLIARLLCEDK